MNPKIKFHFLILCVLPLSFSCSKKSDKAANEEEYMMSRYAQKKERPSPPAKTKIKIGDNYLGLYYSQPSVSGRKIWDDLVPYDDVWRTGANEASVFKTTTKVVIEGDTIEPGKYALFTIPSESSWTVILNDKYDVWGAYDYDKQFDVARFEVIPVLVPEMLEKMTFEIDSTGLVEFAWENLRFNFQVSMIE